MCTNLPSITIPANVETLGADLFAFCDNMNQISFSGELRNFKYVDDVLFDKNKTRLIWYSRWKIEHYEIPPTVTTIDKGAFKECEHLTLITIPNNIREIKTYAFYSCFKLKLITIPNSVTSIGNSAFCRCNELTSITIPSSVTSIGYKAFYECSSLSSIRITESVTSRSFCIFCLF